MILLLPLIVVILLNFVRKSLFGLIADVYGVVKVTMHIINECQVIIGMPVSWIYFYTVLKMLNSHGILLVLEVGES